MITYEKALKLALDSGFSLGEEKCTYLESVGRVLSQDILSDINMPPFNRSAMDGYACRRDDLDQELEVIEIIPAGVFPKKIIGAGQCAKIMTGAPVPEGADTVIMVELTKAVSDTHIAYTGKKTKSNISLKAEDVKVGDVVLKKGTLIQPKHIAVLASVGAVEVEVYKKPRIAIVSTGDELVEPNQIPQASQIRNSNAYQMLAQAMELGVDAEYIGVAKDTKESTKEMLLKAIERADIIIMSGAVSMGDFDFVPIVLREQGVDILFHGMEIKPGKRVVFGVKDKKWFVGVPGNPVSSFVQFEMLIKPLVFKIMGANYETPLFRLPLAHDYKRKRKGRKAFEPIVITKQGRVEKADYNGSAHIHALAYAQGLMIIEADIVELKEGDLVDVRPI